MSTQTAVLALLHDRLGGTLQQLFGGGNPLDLIGINSTNQSLLDQLEQVAGTEDESRPPQITLFFINDIIGASVSSLLQGFATRGLPLALPFFPASTQVASVQSLLAEQVHFFQAGRDHILNLIVNRDPLTVQNAGRELVKLPELWDTLQAFIGNDVGVMLSVATIGNAVPDLQRIQIVSPLEKALLAYFFKKEGYLTLEGASIVVPIHLADVTSSLSGVVAGASGSGLDQFKNVFSKATAEHYLRDTIRVAVDVVYDTVRNLNDKYQSILGKVKNVQTQEAKKSAVERKFVNWFRGFSSLAESTAMRAVEIGTQGVSEFQTNPLIAAAAGSFAGTVARKIAQDSYLRVLELNFSEK